MLKTGTAVKPVTIVRLVSLKWTTPRLPHSCYYTLWLLCDEPEMYRWLPRSCASIKFAVWRGRANPPRASTVRTGPRT